MEYDYSGFPEHTYHVQYPAAGSPDLAKQVGNLLAHALAGLYSIANNST